MKYSQWVEKVWYAICAEAEHGPLGTSWNPLVSDRFLEEIDVPNIRLLEPKDQENILTAIEQAASLLADKGLYETGEHGARLTEYGLRFKGYSPLYLWLGTEISERSGQFLAEAAAGLRIEDPLDLYVMRRPPGT